MAKRSDFAQKLLDDLRMRKEQMGMANSGQHSAQAPFAGDAYGNSRWAIRGSGQATSSRSGNKNIPNTEATKMWLGTRHNRAPSIGGASQDIVPVGRMGNKESIDVSMALALALSNTGKLQNIEHFSNSTMGKKLILHHGSLNFREMDSNMLRTSDQFPFLSPLQIGEISKGIQQLNMILRTCSNGVIFSRDSIDIGRELLKGAIDLEESLRMLVSLQDASDYMTGSQGKKLKLLKGKEEGESSSEEVNNKKLMKPMFSFDKPSKHSRHHFKEVSNSDLLEQKQMALSYSEILKTPESNSNKSLSNASLQYSYHRQSLSIDSGSRPDTKFTGYGNKSSHREEVRSFSKDSKCFTSKNVKNSGSKGSSLSEKVRIPNVVAKLMGLEELPLAMPEVKKIEEKKAPNPKQAGETIKVKADVAKSKKEENQMTYSAPIIKGKNIVSESKGVSETIAVNSLEAVHSKGKKNTKEPSNPEHKDPTSSKAPKLSNSKEMDTSGMDRFNENKVANRETEVVGDEVLTMQQMNEGKVKQGAVGKPTPQHGSQNIALLLHGNSDDKVSKHEKPQRNKDVVPMQQRNPQQQSAINRLKSKHMVHKHGEKIQNKNRNKLESIVAKKKDVKLRNVEISPGDMKKEKVSASISATMVNTCLLNSSDTEQPKEYPKGKHNEQRRVQNRNSTYPGVDRKSKNEISEAKRPLKAAAKTEKEKNMPLYLAPAIRKLVPSPSAQKVDVTELMRSRNENTGILIDENRRIEAGEKKVQNLKQKASFLHELEHRWKKRTGKTEAIVSSHPTKTDHHSQQIIVPTNVQCNSDESEFLRSTDHIITAKTTVDAPQEEAANPTPSRDTTITESAALHTSEISIKKDVQQQPLLEENKSEGPTNGRQLSNCHWKNIETSGVHVQGLLTKDEYILKQILMNSQHFLNTAQALFKIKIPISVLQAGENICHHEGDELVVDTGYEIMRRKGKRGEALFSEKLPFALARMRCLDDLIKELKNDLRCLEPPSKTEGIDNDIAECLHKMIERDIQNSNPDVNCMWDICWNSMTFANIEKEEILRDVEKHMLNGLINDLARDLMSVSISI